MNHQYIDNEGGHGSHGGEYLKWKEKRSRMGPGIIFTLRNGSSSNLTELNG